MSHTEQMREAFEAWLRTKPEARLWNTTDAMFTAYCAALTHPAQPAEGGEAVAEFDEMRGRPVLLPGAPMLAHKQKLYTAPPASQEQAPTYTYASTQATRCASCGAHKHTPLRIDAMGGYVCLTCIDQKLGSLLGEFGYPEPDEDSQEQAAKARAWDRCRAQCFLRHAQLTIGDVIDTMDQLLAEELEASQEQAQQPDDQEATVADYQEALRSVDALVRRLDIAINGDQASPQARLCDIVSQVEQAQQQPSIAGFKVVLDPTMPPDQFKFVQQPSGGEVDDTIARLMQFYDADNLQSLALAQCKHVERLQAKLPRIDMPAFTRVREV